MVVKPTLQKKKCLIHICGEAVLNILKHEDMYFHLSCRSSCPPIRLLSTTYNLYQTLKSIFWPELQR